MKRHDYRAIGGVRVLAGALLLLVAAVSLRGAPDDAVHVRIMRLPDGHRFGLIGERQSRPAPTLFLLVDSIETQQEPIYTDGARLLLKDGVISIALDLPAHGEDLRPGEPPGMAGGLFGWRQRFDHGDDITGSFNVRARAVLDYLVKEGYTDPARVAVWGCSRGGFIAFHFAAVEPRIRLIAATSPVTDLMALREFNGASLRRAEELNLLQIIPAIAGRPAWISIGNNDRRVDVDRVIAFSRALVRATAKRKEEGAVIPVDLIVAPSWHSGGTGHYAIGRSNELYADWICRQFGLPAIPDAR